MYSYRSYISPKLARVTQHREGWGHSLNAWQGHMVGARRALRMAGKGRLPDVTRIERMLEEAGWWEAEMPADLVIDNMRDMKDIWEQTHGEWTAPEPQVEGFTRRRKCDREVADSLRARLTAQIDRVAVHERKAHQKEIRANIKKFSQQRQDNFDDKSGKGKGKCLNSLFRVVKQFEEITAAIDEKNDGSTETKPEEVSRVVRSFFEDWMQSRITAQTRWGGVTDKEAWKRMLDLDCTVLEKRYADFVREAYQEQLDGNKQRSQDQGWWDKIMIEPSTEELTELIGQLDKSSSPGMSQVGNIALKMLDEAGIGVIQKN